MGKHSKELSAPQRIAVIGAAGMVGRLCVYKHRNPACGFPYTDDWVQEPALIIPLTRKDLDITDADAVAHTELLNGVTAVVNLAAWTAVDAAEDPANREAVTAVNALAPGYLAERCVRESAHLVHVSTDYVFGSGAPRRPLRPSDEPNPDTVYGETKYAGEKAIAATDGVVSTIVRTGWLYAGDIWGEKHRDFVTTMVGLAEKGDTPVRVVDDQWGTPTFAGELAVWLRRYAGGDASAGVRYRHVVGCTPCTWYTFAREIFTACGADPDRVIPCRTVDFPRPAPRPPWSVLASDEELAPAALWLNECVSSVQYRDHDE